MCAYIIRVRGQAMYMVGRMVVAYSLYRSLSVFASIHGFVPVVRSQRCFCSIVYARAFFMTGSAYVSACIHVNMLRMLVYCMFVYVHTCLHAVCIYVYHEAFAVDVFVATLSRLRRDGLSGFGRVGRARIVLLSRSCRVGRVGRV